MGTPPLSRLLLRVSKVHVLLYGIRAGFLDDVATFPHVVEHVFGQRCHSERGVLKCSTSPKDY
jgi:hypothetical protein